MVEEARSAWADLPEQVRTWTRRGAYAGGLLFALVGGVAVSPATRPDEVIRAQVERNTAAIDTLRTEGRSLRVEMEFLSCDRLAERGVPGYVTEVCIASYQRAVRGRP